MCNEKFGICAMKNLDPYGIYTYIIIYKLIYHQRVGGRSTNTVQFIDQFIRG